MSTEKKKVVLFTCNRQKCANCSPECFLTEDVEFARDFELDTRDESRDIYIQMNPRTIV